MSSMGSAVPSSATRSSYSSAANRSQSDIWERRTFKYPFFNVKIESHLVAIFVCFSLCCKGIPLLVVEVLLQVEERVEEHWRHLALLQVLQSDGVLVQGADHVKHLKGEGELVN